MIDPIPCPLCLHQQTMNARLARREAIHDDPPLMFWQVPTNGIRAQICTDRDRGWWECRECYLQLSAHAAGVFLDAALIRAFPSCDSIAGGLHADVRRAWLERPTPAQFEPEEHDREGEIAAILLAHSYVQPDQPPARVLRETDFGKAARAILARCGRLAAPPGPEVATSERPAPVRPQPTGGRLIRGDRCPPPPTEQ